MMIIIRLMRMLVPGRPSEGMFWHGDRTMACTIVPFCSREPSPPDQALVFLTIATNNPTMSNQWSSPPRPTSSSSTKTPVMMTAVSLENAIPSTVSFPTCFVKSDGTLLFDDISRGWNERLKIPPFLCLFQRCQQFGRVKRTVGSEVEPRAGGEP